MLLLYILFIKIRIKHLYILYINPEYAISPPKRDVLFGQPDNEKNASKVSVDPAILYGDKVGEGDGHESLCNGNPLCVSTSEYDDGDVCDNIEEYVASYFNSQVDDDSISSNPHREEIEDVGQNIKCSLNLTSSSSDVDTVDYIVTSSELIEHRRVVIKDTSPTNLAEPKPTVYVGDTQKKTWSRIVFDKSQSRDCVRKITSPNVSKKVCIHYTLYAILILNSL